MSWTTLLVIAAGAYLFKALGLVASGGWQPPPIAQRCLDLLPAALLAALVVVNTVITDRHVAIDARLAGVVAAAIATWRRLPFPVIVLVGAAVAAFIRRVS